MRREFHLASTGNEKCSSSCIHRVVSSTRCEKRQPNRLGSSVNHISHCRMMRELELSPNVTLIYQKPVIISGDYHAYYCV